MLTKSEEIEINSDNPFKNDAFPRNAVKNSRYMLKPHSVLSLRVKTIQKKSKNISIKRAQESQSLMENWNQFSMLKKFSNGYRSLESGGPTFRLVFSRSYHFLHNLGNRPPLQSSDPPRFAKNSVALKPLKEISVEKRGWMLDILNISAALSVFGRESLYRLKPNNENF